jgi:hypothetical protein
LNPFLFISANKEMQRQGGGAYDVSCGCDMKNPLPAYAYSLEAARDVKGGARRRRTSTRKQRGGGCGCSGGAEMLPMRGGGCGCSGGAGMLPMRGGGCGCALKGGYKATARNRKYLAKWRRGESIGFTMKASLKAKGLLPRSSKKNYGKKVLGNKYK